MDEISFTKGDFDSFKKMYESAKKNGSETFSFNGRAFNVSYAKYLIEYLEDKFK